MVIGAFERCRHGWMYEYVSVPLLALAQLVGWSIRFCWAMEGWSGLERAKLKMVAGGLSEGGAGSRPSARRSAASLPTGPHGGLHDSTAGCFQPAALCRVWGEAAAPAREAARAGGEQQLQPL